MIGALDSQLPREFFLALSTNAKMTLHIDNLKGINAHHQCESVLNLEERSAWLQPSMNALKCHSFYQRDTMKIAVVDYGSGNLRSVYQAIKKVAPLNSDVWVTEDPNKVKEADRVIFPAKAQCPTAWGIFARPDWKRR